MRVFVTGASGFVGSAVVRELLAAGHQVVGLARSDTAAAAVQAAGAAVRRGSLHDLAGLREAAAAADGVIHTAYNHDWAHAEDVTQGFLEAARMDRCAIEAMGEALAGSDRPFVVTSGTPAVGNGRIATENDTSDPASLAGARTPSETTALSFAERGVRASVVRLPRSVHSDADRHGFVPTLIGIARAKGVSAYVGDGSNRWNAVHQLDAAHLFRLALEQAPAGTRLHAVGDESVPVRDIAEVIGRHLTLPVTAVSPDEAAGHFGAFALFASIDSPASAMLTRKLLDWRPERPGLIADLEEGHYFERAE